jgi:hypothetical protein
MDSISKLDKLLSLRVPFSFARFNDGEMMGIEQAGVTVARGDQFIDNDLHEKLKKSLMHQEENYWIGMPCKVCFPQYDILAQSLTQEDYPYKTKAVVLINRNYHFTKSRLKEWLSGRKIIWISGEDQSLDVVSDLYDLDIEEHIKVSCQDGWKSYNDLANANANHEKKVFILSCGPLSRVLACEYWQSNKSNTYLDVGSLFDDTTRGVRHGFHKDTLAPCKECN